MHGIKTSLLVENGHQDHPVAFSGNFGQVAVYGEWLDACNMIAQADAE